MKLMGGRDKRSPTDLDRPSLVGAPWRRDRATPTGDSASVPVADPNIREFGLREPSRDPGLERQLALGRWLEDDLAAAVALSGMTGSRIRDTFPAEKANIQVIPCVSGLDLAADTADIFAASCALGKLQEEADFSAFMTLVRPGAVVVDVGANFGLYAAHAALYAGSDGSVFAFEPGPDAFAILQSNIARNSLRGRVTAVQAAIGPADGRATFRVAADSAFSGLRDTGRSRTVGHIDVELCALDSYSPLAGRAVDLIKIDTEGGEAGVLAGAHELLARSPEVVVMFEFSHKNLDADGRAQLIAELERLQGAGLALFRRDGGRLAELQPSELVGPRSENLFLARPACRACAALSDAVGLPPPQPTADQEVALAILRRHGEHVSMHNDLCRRIVETAKSAMEIELAQQPLLAVETLAGRLRVTATEVESAGAQAEAASTRVDALEAALARARSRYDELRAAHTLARERLEATFKSRDAHRAASRQLFEEVEELKLRLAVHERPKDQDAPDDAAAAADKT